MPNPCTQYLGGGGEGREREGGRRLEKYLASLLAQCTVHRIRNPGWQQEEGEGGQMYMTERQGG